MKNNSLFTVPEGYFESAALRAASNGRRIVRRRRVVLAGALSAMCVALLILVSSPGSNGLSHEFDYLSDSELAELVEFYESDVFLSLNN